MVAAEGSFVLSPSLLPPRGGPAGKIRTLNASFFLNPTVIDKDKIPATLVFHRSEKRSISYCESLLWKREERIKEFQSPPSPA